MKALKITGMAIAGITFFAAAIVLASWILSLLWNWLMPGIFGLPEIGLLQAGGLFILSKLLFTPSFGSDKSSNKTHKKTHWKNHFKSKMRKKCYEEVPTVNNPEESQ